jgi:hypothetical protein
VAVHSAQDTNFLELGRSSSFVGIEQVEWNDDGTLVCAAYLSRTILVYRVTQSSKHRGGWDAETVVDMSVGDLDITALNGFSAQEPYSLARDFSDLDLDADSPSITLIELPEELVDRMYRPLSFITARGAGSEMLLFLDCDSSIRSWSVRRASISSHASQASLTLGRTTSTPARSASGLISPPEYPSSRRESVPSIPESRIGPKLSTSASSSQFEPPRRGSAVSASGSQAQTVPHYCLPSDWVSPDCVKLLRTLGDGTLLCPHNGQVSVVKCKSLSGSGYTPGARWPSSDQCHVSRANGKE